MIAFLVIGNGLKSDFLLIDYHRHYQNLDRLRPKYKIFLMDLQEGRERVRYYRFAHRLSGLSPIEMLSACQRLQATLCEPASGSACAIPSFFVSGQCEQGLESSAEKKTPKRNRFAVFLNSPQKVK
jgi:hypothetical protein